MKNHLKRHLSLLAVTSLLGSLIATVYLQMAHAAPNTQITNRSLTLSAGATDGGSKPGGTVRHRYVFTLNNTTEALGSITFQYCTTAAAVTSGINCVAPTGLNVSGASLTQDLGVAGFTTLNTSSVCDSSCGIVNTITVGRASTTTLGAPTAVTKEFNGIVNPSTEGTFFVRITTRTSLDGSGGVANDSGTVTAATAEQIILTGTMPESLIFCTGRTVSETNNVPDCATAGTGVISFNQLFSPQSTAWASSQMAASTNAGTGYIITVNGPTLTSGSNTIAGIPAAGGDFSKPGTPQFGINLAADAEVNALNPPISPLSAGVTSPSGGSLYNGRALPPYDVGDATADSTLDARYRYVDGDTIADSNSDASDTQVYTVTYLANVPGSQPAGTYSTTLTYICTPTF